MILGNKRYTYSPVPQSFIWIAEYYDGTHLAEYNLTTHQSNSFYHIQRDKLIRFGLIGEGSQVYINVADGTFTLNDHRLTISYEADGVEFPLTGRTFLYNDIISYKDAVADACMLGTNQNHGMFEQTIVQYNMGYKKTMQLLDVNIHFQCVLGVPYQDASFLQIKITTDKDLDGKLIIRRNGFKIDTIQAPLKCGAAGTINWEIR
ncbi:hypothetical protein [Paenibacillus sp. UMB4589-SE434]|uniref:hypothetical protein n=1 Tax=Paenibacillus sp. UMB4589-SE434 TaxID=3046314 RepID=UPI00254D33D0|nr:hypothetical protein [Paenibacillus sp. UMB4589-SE434]MDK8179407.1 hypothetical protein [Paenibacillus sp. UMB4589-SE434]